MGPARGTPNAAAAGNPADFLSPRAATPVIFGEGGPFVGVSARVSALIAGPLVKAVETAQRAGQRVDPEVLATVADFERLARAHRASARSLLDAQRAGSGTLARANPAESQIISPTMIGTPEAAPILRCQRRNVVALAQRGTLPGEKVGGRWLFDPADVAALARAREEQR